MKVYFDTNILMEYCSWRYLNNVINKDALQVFEMGLKGNYEIVISDYSIIELIRYFKSKSIKDELIDVISKEIKRSKEITFINIETIGKEFMNWVEKYVRAGVDLNVAYILRICQDCGCAFFITNDKEVLKHSVYLKENNLLDFGFSILNVNEFRNHIVHDLIDISYFKTYEIMQNEIKNYFSKLGYNTIATPDSFVDSGYDIIFKNDNKLIGVEIKSNYSTKISKSVITNFMNRNDNFEKYIVSQSGFTKDAIETANKNKDKIKLIDYKEISQKYKLLNVNYEKSYLIKEKNIKENILKDIWEKMKKGKNENEKGDLLEDWTEELLKNIDGLELVGRDIRTNVEEIDFLIANNSNHPFWQKRCDPFIIECKNWRSKIGSDEVKVFSANMDRRKITDGILIAVNGVTGNQYKDAYSYILEQRANGKRIILLDKKDIIELNEGINPTDKIREKFYDLYK